MQRYKGEYNCHIKSLGRDFKLIACHFVIFKAFIFVFYVLYFIAVSGLGWK